MYIKQLLHNFKDLFFKEGDTLSATTEIRHNITTTIDKPLYSKIYRYPQIHENEIQRQILEMLENKIIRESNSPYNSPLWIVPKKIDNSGLKKWRLVIDYRKLNEHTVDDKFPIPNLNSLLDKLGKSQYFTTLDLAKGFHQILVKEEDRKKTAFSTPFGHYEFIRMPFGLKNAPSTFQRMMNTVLRDYINKICVVYMDDILVFSTSLKEHIINLMQIFKALRNARLKIQVDKCDFLKKETHFLGHILTTDGVKPDVNKISVIQNLRLPTTEKQIKSFLGMTGFYRKFIRDYAKIAQPLTNVLKKKNKININNPCFIAAFEKLKELITNSPILRYPNFNKRFKIITDASNFAIGAVLMQDGHPLAYASRTLNDHEINYATIEKELLAIVWGVKYFRPYIYGREFDLESDHQPLKWLLCKYSGRDISPRLQRNLIDLGEYNFKIEYIKGKYNYIADFLSRIDAEPNEINILTNSNNRSDEDNDSMEVETVHSQEEDLNNYIPILETVVNRFRSQIILKNKKDKDFEMVFNNKRIFIDKNDIENKNVINIVRREFTKGKVGIFSELNDHEYNKLQKVLVSEFPDSGIKFVKCTYFAKDVEEVDEVNKQVALFHKYESGHSGMVATYEGIKNLIYSPNLKTSIHKIINNCHICSCAKYDRNPIRRKFQQTETPSTTNEIVHVDTYFNSKNCFIVFLDKFSKHAVSFHLSDRNSVTIVQKLREFISIKGNIKKFIFDNEFGSNNVKEFLLKEGIDYHLTKPNSHTGNSDVERLNNTITERIRALNIEEKLPIETQMTKAIKYYNNSFHSTIQCTPLDVVNNKIDYKVVRNRIKKTKVRVLNKLNVNRENYVENRQEGYIKNYANLRHKEQPKFRKYKLHNVHEDNIKRPLKFSDPCSGSDNLLNAVEPCNSANKPNLGG